MARMRTPLLSYRWSAIVGCVLVGIAAAWFLWIFFGPQSGTIGPGVRWLQPAGTPVSVPQVPVLLAHGITFSSPEAKATLSQQQALFLAGQHEPDSTHAKRVTSWYALVSSTMSLMNLHASPAWVICYQGIPQPSGGAHDLYVFLDANSGTELFTLWT